MASNLLIFNHQILLLLLIIILSFVENHPHLDYDKNNPSQNSFGFINHFSTTNNTQIFAQIGGIATLPCIVSYSSLATVSWIKDHHLLTVGLTTYSSDDRFIVEHTRHEGFWDLRIKPIHKEDQGVYKCQISTHPPQSIFIELKVVG